jgi:aspartyl-tRNA(Asn)/glutamyl-tRNA(Gln) amidotransferase subunit C
MASQLTRDDVAGIAELARLELSADEQEALARQLGDILAYAATVQQADTTGIEPLRADVSASLPAWRADAPVASLRREDVLREAPEAALEAGLFRVPKVL